MADIIGAVSPSAARGAETVCAAAAPNLGGYRPAAAHKQALAGSAKPLDQSGGLGVY